MYTQTVSAHITQIACRGREQLIEMGELERDSERLMAQEQLGSAASLPRVSIITPTYNRKDPLLATLRALARQTVSPTSFEALVISDGSTDGTAEACAQLDVPYTLRYFEQDHQGPAAARNLGLQEARGELIVFLDDDVVPDPELIATYIALHEEQPHAVGVGPLLPPPDVRLQPWVWWEEKMLLQQYDALATGKWSATFRQFYTGNASVRRQDALDAGGFDSRFRRAEDVELALRMDQHGLTFHFLPNARALHYARRSFRSWFDIPRAYALVDLHMASQPGQSWENFSGGEFQYRDPLLQKIAKVTVGHPLRCKLVVQVCAISARVLARIPLKVCDKLAIKLFSLVFNLRYWQTLAEELGTERFWTVVMEQLSDEAEANDPQPSVSTMK